MFPSGRPQNMQPGGQLPMVQYPGMYYSTSNPASAPSRQSNISAQADDGRDLLAESYKRMRNEMRSLQGVAKPDAPPPPSMDSSRDNVAIKMLLNNENVSLSSLLEAAMDPSSGSNKGTEDPIMKKTVLDKCEGKIAQLYRHRISGMGTFFPNVPPKGTKANSSSFLTFHHPRIEFNMTAIDAVWNCPEVNLEAGQRRRTAETAVERDSVQRDKSPALEAAEVYANKPNPSVSTHLFSNNQPEPRKPTELPPGLIPELPPGPITVIAPRRKDVPVVDLTSYTEPPPDPYATTAFELWAEIERERRHKEKLKEWEMLNEKHKQKEQEKEERKKKKKRHRHSRSRSRSRRRSRSYSRSRSRSRHRERRWRSRSRRRTRSISLSPSPSRKRSRSPRYIEQRRLSRSPERRSSRHTTSPSTLISPPKYPSDSRLQPGPPGHEWSTSSAWPQNTSNVPPTSEYYQYGNSQVHPEGSDYYYGNNRPYPPFNLPQNRYGLRPPFPLRGYPMGGHRGGPHMWGPRGPPPYGYRPPLMDLAPPPPADSTTEKSKTVIKRFYVKSTSNPNLLEVDTFPSVIQKLGKDSANKTSKQEPDVIVIPTSQIDSSQKRIDDVIVLDDDNGTDVKTVPRASSASEDHPPGVSPDRELPQTTIKMSLNKESEFTKPLRAKFRELLEPIEKILDTLRVRQRDSYEFKTLIRGLEIGSCEFDGVYTLVEGILCRVVIDAMESAKTCFKIVLSPVHVTPILMEIHKMYHDYTSSKIKSMIEDLFYDSRLFPSWKIGNVIAICKQCKSAAEARRKKRDEKEGALQRSSERDESNDVDRESRSKSKSCRRRSESTDRDDGKKGRRGSRDDRKAPRDRPEKTELHRGKKRELKDITLKGGDVLLNVVGEPSKKVKDSPKHTARGTEKVTGSADDKSELVSSKAAESKTGKTKAVEKDVVKGKSSSKLEEGKSASSKVNHSELPDAPMKKGGPAQSNPAPSVKPQEGPKMEDAHGRNGENSGSSPLKRGTELSKKPLVPYSFGNKPEDFKLRVRRVQLSVDDLKTHITRLERPDGKSADPNFLLKAGMLCKRVPTDDGKTEVKIAVTPPSLLEMIQIVHTMAATHAPLEKTITVFNKHFTPMGGVQEAVTVVLNNCEVCKSS